jgi:hypothetical protein
MIYTQYFRPLSKGSTLTIKFNPAIISPVIAILLVSCPSTILRRISLIIINSVKLMFGSWRMPHIRKEAFKGVPRFTNGYATSTVNMELGVFGVIASLMNPCPSPIGLRVRHSMRSRGHIIYPFFAYPTKPIYSVGKFLLLHGEEPIYGYNVCR